MRYVIIHTRLECHQSARRIVRKSDGNDGSAAVRVQCTEQVKINRPATRQIGNDQRGPVPPDCLHGLV